MRGWNWIGWAAPAMLLAPLSAWAQDDPAIARRLERLIAERPVIDGHNDLPWELRERHSGVDAFDRIVLDRRTDTLDLPLQTDIPRLRAGGYGAQFWSLWIPADITGDAAVVRTIEAIDMVKRMAARYPADFALADSVAGIEAARREGRIAALMGIEGGHQIAGSLSVLRRYRDLGVLYMTLTHSRNVDWADSGTDAPGVRGLTPFGREVIAEMNRIGMIVDLSHVSPDTARAAIEASRAPVMFSHSNAHAVNPHPRNVPDDVLKLAAAKGGVVMVNVYPVFVSAPYCEWQAAKAGEEARLTASPGGLALGEAPEQVAARMAAWMAANPPPRVTVADVADHVEHIARVAGRDHVGLGGDYDGISGVTPEQMEGVDGWRALFVELMRRGWSDGDLKKLVGGNILRVLRQVEEVAGGGG